MGFVVTTALLKIWAMKARKKVIQGGTSAGKTYGIIPIIANKAIRTPRLLITIVGETIPAVRDGAAKIFMDVMEATNRWQETSWSSNPMQYTFKNGSKIQFKSFDKIGKAKGVKRDILFINEANHIPYKIADALIVRSKDIYIDFNPDNYFWAHTEILREPNSEFLKLTYRDNEALPEETLEDLMIRKEKAKTSKYWGAWCKVYLDGEVGRLEGIIFTDWEAVDIVPQEASLIGYGLDFGYTNDPTALVAAYKYDDLIVWDEVIYQKRLKNSEIAEFMKAAGVGRTAYIYADSAEPKSIAELNAYGFHVMPTQKGADSVSFGIAAMQEQPFRVTKRSVNVIEELRRYSWDEDKQGNRLNRPVDAFNHCIDAMRYLTMMRIARQKKTAARIKAQWF